ncbi:MAG: OmpH family outer membrane protein [Bacteroidetes bacterium]|nr:OmpH family outer membrane protein [Bacteroidota bacterium]MBU2584891.1 OmpH family outer membrane protein [Bacteroidota bacterium]
MKNLFFVLIIFFTANVFAQVPVKVGIVDSEVILAALPDYKTAQEKLNEIIKGWQSVLDSLTTDYQMRLESYRKQEAMMTEDNKMKAQQELIKMEQDILGYRQKRFGQQGDIVIKQEELLAPIKKKIINMIEKVAKEEKITLVLDKAGDVVVLFSDPSYDITFKVLDRLKRG